MHEGHRKRMKERFLKEGLDSFQPHNVLELLLFYAIPKKDTNELAHTLMNQFGSLSGVLDAEISDLVHISGIGEHTAILLKIIPQLARIYQTDRFTQKCSLRTMEEIGEYLIKRYIGYNKEVVFLTLLNNKWEIIDCVKVFEGIVNSSHIYTRQLAQIALQRDASMVILSHNHPKGDTIPSPEDLQTTAELVSFFEKLETPLVEHILVAENKFVPLLRIMREMEENPYANE